MEKDSQDTPLLTPFEKLFGNCSAAPHLSAIRRSSIPKYRETSLLTNRWTTAEQLNSKFYESCSAYT